LKIANPRGVNATKCAAPVSEVGVTLNESPQKASSNARDQSGKQLAEEHAGNRH
jgi:hypothetical protein